MFIRVSLYLIASILLGCAGDLDDQITKQDFNEDGTVESNESVRVSPKVEDEVDEPISAKASEVATRRYSLNRRLSLHPRLGLILMSRRILLKKVKSLWLIKFQWLKNCLNPKCYLLLSQCRQKKRSNYPIQVPLPSPLQKSLAKGPVSIAEYQL